MSHKNINNSTIEEMFECYYLILNKVPLKIKIEKLKFLKHKLSEEDANYRYYRYLLKRYMNDQFQQLSDIDCQSSSFNFPGFGLECKPEKYDLKKDEENLLKTKELLKLFLNKSNQQIIKGGNEYSFLQSSELNPRPEINLHFSKLEILYFFNSVTLVNNLINSLKNLKNKDFYNERRKQCLAFIKSSLEQIEIVLNNGKNEYKEKAKKFWEFLKESVNFCNSPDYTFVIELDEINKCITDTLREIFDFIRISNVKEGTAFVKQAFFTTRKYFFFFLEYLKLEIKEKKIVFLKELKEHLLLKSIDTTVRLEFYNSGLFIEYSKFYLDPAQNDDKRLDVLVFLLEIGLGMPFEVENYECEEDHFKDILLITLEKVNCFDIKLIKFLCRNLKITLSENTGFFGIFELMKIMNDYESNKFQKLDDCPYKSLNMIQELNPNNGKKFYEATFSTDAHGISSQEIYFIKRSVIQIQSFDDMIFNEAILLNKLNYSKKTVKIFGTKLVIKNKDILYLDLVLEKYDFDLKSIYPESTHIKFLIMKEISRAIEHLHVNEKIVHDDIKPGNILIKKKEGSFVCVLTDFDISQNISDLTSKTEIGRTPIYKPHYHDSRTRFPNDIYSLGIVFLNLLYGQFNEKNLEGIFKTCQNQYRSISKIIELMIQPQFNKRCDIQTVVKFIDQL